MVRIPTEFGLITIHQESGPSGMSKKGQVCWSIIAKANASSTPKVSGKLVLHLNKSLDNSTHTIIVPIKNVIFPSYASGHHCKNGWVSLLGTYKTEISR